MTNNEWEEHRFTGSDFLVAGYSTCMSWFDDAEDILARMKKAQMKEAHEWENFTPRALRAFADAGDEARAMNLNFLGIEHLLLGLLMLGSGVAVNVMKSHGINLESFRALVYKMHGGVSETQSPPFHITLTPRLKHVLANAKKEAAALNHTYIGTEHLLLSILLETDGVPFIIFKQANIDPNAMRAEILEEIQPRKS